MNSADGSSRGKLSAQRSELKDDYRNDKFQVLLYFKKQDIVSFPHAFSENLFEKFI